MFFTKKKNAEVSMVVDIGNSSVGVALVSVEKNVAPKILFSTRVHMPMQNKPERERKVLSVTSTLETVMSTVMSQHIPIQCSHIFFSAPWYISTTEVIKAEHETPQIFTHRTIEQITKGVESKLMHSTELKSELVERRIIRTKLNGYETSGPNNMKATSVEVVFYASLVSSDILAAVKRVIEKHFHIRHNQVSTFSLAAWSAITSLMPEYRDFFIVDVRGEETDVSLISNGVLLKNTSFSKGKNSLARSVSASAGQSHTAALSLVNVATHGDGSSSLNSDVMKLSEKFKKNWLEECTKSFQQLTLGTVSPKKVFLLAEPDVDVFFESILDEVKIGELYTLKHLNARNFVESSSVFTDPFLALESIFVTMI